MKYKQKQEKAKILYLNSSLNQKQIAEQVSVTENTISKWVEKFGWKTVKAAMSVTKDSIIKNAYAQIAAIQDKITGEERISTPAETDQMLKLSKLISDLNKKIDASVVIQVFTDFEKNLHQRTHSDRELNIEFLKKVNRYHDLYVTNMLNDNQ